MAKQSIEETDPKKSVSHLETLRKIGKIVKAARKNKGWSIATLAKESKVNFITIGDLEEERLVNTTLKTLYQLSAALGVKINFTAEFTD